MVTLKEAAGDKQAVRETSDASRSTSAPAGGYAPHPLFPRTHDGPELRDIQLVTFRRRHRDDRIEQCPEDIPAAEIRSWAAVEELWGGGAYQAIGKDKNHRIVAWYPEKKDAWMLFEVASKPFTYPGQRRALAGRPRRPHRRWRCPWRWHLAGRLRRHRSRWP